MRNLPVPSMTRRSRLGMTTRWSGRTTPAATSTTLTCSMTMAPPRCAQAAKKTATQRIERTTEW
ncbi:MAG TPA: hypothetical protein VJZ76_25365 [Thermoanaerobaculia bacterium]|nr:hypothetical protein [Thermoanaerobaculia bacterium]